MWGLSLINASDMGIELDYRLMDVGIEIAFRIWCGDWAWLTHLMWGLSLYTVSDVGIEKAFPIWCGDWNLFPIWCEILLISHLMWGLRFISPSDVHRGVEIDFTISCGDWDSFPILCGDWDSFPNLIWGLRLNDTHNQAPLSKTLLNYVIELHRKCDPLTSPFPPINPTWKSP